MSGFPGRFAEKHPMDRAPAAPAHAVAPRRRWGPAIAMFVAALAVFGGLAAYLRMLERGALSGGVSDDASSGRVRAVARVEEMISALKVLTVEVRTTANLTVRDESWRGDVEATVEAPVRMFFGTDLARALIAWGEEGPATRTLRIIAPVPERLATEVIGEAEETEVQVGWLRFRSRAGEYYLGQARRGIYDAARQMTLSEKDAAQVRQTTRQRIAELAGKFLANPQVSVTVAFADE